MPRVDRNCKGFVCILHLNCPLPVFTAPFFESCINEQDLDEMNIEIIRNTLYKSYLESFYNFCKNIGGEMADVMCEVLGFEADRRAFIITINSFGKIEAAKCENEGV